MKLERAVIEVFGGCNYSCSMCPQSWGRGSNFTKKMPLSLFEDILDQLTPQYGKPVINLEGSGEPTLAKDLPLYIEACTKRNLPSFMYCNGSRLRGKFMQDVIDAGLDFVRFSFIGYTPKLYREWMSKDNFYQIIENAQQTKEYINQTKSNCEVSSYHLITDPKDKDYEVDQYRKTFIDPVGSIGYVWMMHNWSGNYQPGYTRFGTTKKTCGRPFAPEITIRAGGLNGKQGAVTPCCQTMGPPNEEKSVLGHFGDQSFEEIYFGDAYEDLREAHRQEEFDRIDYCKNCDFLIENPEVLVWSNDPTATIDYMLGTQFSLADFKSR